MKLVLSHDAVVARLAGHLLQVSEGERLQSVRELAKNYGVSVGAISNALSTLETRGAAKFQRRGHLGLFIEQQSLGELWTAAENTPLVIAFPLIAHARLEGLATALKQQISAAGLDVYLIFVRGSRTRLKLLRENKCHIVVSSQFAAAKLMGDGEQALLTLPAFSYVSEHQVFFRVDKIQGDDPLCVAIDRDSFDVQALTELEFMGKDVAFQSVTFMQLPRLLKTGAVDVGVWSIDDMRPHLDEQIMHRSLSPWVEQIVGQSNTAAALIGRVDSPNVRALVHASLDADEILETQRRVVDGNLVPTY